MINCCEELTERCKGAGGSTLVCAMATSDAMNAANSSNVRITGAGDFRALQLSFATDGESTTSSSVSNTAAAWEVDAMTGRRDALEKRDQAVVQWHAAHAPSGHSQAHLASRCSGTVVRRM